MNDQGLYPAFLPSHPLAEPISEFVRSFLPGVRIQRFHTVAKARQTYSKVRVLGNVPFVPSPYGAQGSNAKVIGTAPKGNWQVKRAQARIEEIEQYCVLDRKEL